MSQDQKREAIIEAAIKRFSHFGASKTTMTEISNDLSLSKASLYYYFPDKLSLYAAVIKHITQVGEAITSEQLKGETDPLRTILLYLEIRTNFIIKYYNVLEYLNHKSMSVLPPELHSIFSYAKESELRIIISILEKGRKQNIFDIKNLKETAELFYDFLESFRHSMFSRNADFFPDKKQFQYILKKERAFATIFFNGLSCKK